jgi:hypothetical protein
MKRSSVIYLIILQLVFVSLSGFGETSVGVGTDITADLSTPVVLPEVWIDASSTGYHPFNPSLAITYDTAGSFAYEPVNSVLSGNVLGDLHLSWIRDYFRSRFGVLGVFLASNIDPAISWSAEGDAEFSYDSFSASISAHPKIGFRGRSGTTTVGIEGSTEVKGMVSLSPYMLLDASVSGGLFKTVQEYNGYFYGVEAGISLYPSARMIINGNLHWNRKISDHEEVIVNGEPSVPVDSFHKIAFQASADIAIGRKLRSRLTLPASIYLMDHQAVDADTYTGAGEINADISPELAVWYDLSEKVRLETVLGGTFYLSNTPVNCYSEIFLEAGIRISF